jgi:hypothetical protein
VFTISFNRETLRLEPSENAEWTLKLEPELQRTLQAAKTSKLIDAAEVEQEGNDAKINIRVIPPESLGKPMIIQYNPVSDINLQFAQIYLLSHKGK